YIETRYAARLLTGNAAGVGYLLKDRVADVADFVDALTRVAAGGTALDPEVVRQLLGAHRDAHGLTDLTPREREVLALMAAGRPRLAAHLRQSRGGRAGAAGGQPRRRGGAGRPAAARTGGEGRQEPRTPRPAPGRPGGRGGPAGGARRPAGRRGPGP